MTAVHPWHRSNFDICEQGICEYLAQRTSCAAVVCVKVVVREEFLVKLNKSRLDTQCAWVQLWSVRWRVDCCSTEVLGVSAVDPSKRVYTVCLGGHEGQRDRQGSAHAVVIR